MDEQMVEQVSADDGFGDFASAFGEEFGNQTEEPAEEAETEETGGEDAQQTEDGQDSAGDDTGAPSEAAPDAETDPPAEPDPADSFTIKVNKQERTVTRKEMISLAQKGSDYDRVKQQLTESREAAKNLQTRLDQQAETMNLLEMLAQSSNMTTDKLIEAM